MAVGNEKDKEEFYLYDMLNFKTKKVNWPALPDVDVCIILQFVFNHLIFSFLWPRVINTLGLFLFLLYPLRLFHLCLMSFSYTLISTVFLAST